MQPFNHALIQNFMSQISSFPYVIESIMFVPSVYTCPPPAEFFFDRRNLFGG